MFNPKYKLSPYFLKTVEMIAGHMAIIKRSRLSVAAQLRLEKEFSNRSVHSSTWIEGNTLSLDQVNSLAAHKNIIAEENQKKEVLNCLQATRWMLNYKGKVLTLDKLLKLHAILTKDLLPQDRSGRLRTIQNYIVNAQRKIIYTPPAPQEVEPRIKNLFRWLKQFPEEHPIVRSAIFHHEFVAIHLFVDGNGRTARIASQWMLLEKGVEPLYTLGLDEFYAHDRARYYNMIQQTHDMDEDFSFWIDYVAEGLLHSVQKVSQRIKSLKTNTKIFLTPKQEELIQILHASGILGSAQICKKMNINRARVNQLIAPLIKFGLVKKIGQTHSVKYMI